MKRAKKRQWPNEVVFLILLVAAGGFIALGGGFQPVTFADTTAYLGLSVRPFWSVQTLSVERTFGYPLILKVFNASRNLHWVPLFQFLVLVLSIGVFYRGLRGLAFSIGRSALISTVLFASVLAGYYSHPSLVATDSCGLYLAIAALGMALGAGRPEAKVFDWVGLGTFAFLTYQVRPAYLPLLAALTVVTLVVATMYRSTNRVKRDRTALWKNLGLSLVVPFIAFCALRWLAVGHFGLVSFGGTNLCGIAGQLLSPELVPRLPEDLRPLAEATLLRREDPKILAHYGFKKWENAFVGNTGVTRTTAGEYFNFAAWEVVIPLAREMTAGDQVAVNRLVSRFSVEVVKLRPIPYAIFVAKNFCFSLMMVFTAPLFIACVLLLGTLYFVYLAAQLARRVPPTFVVRDETVRLLQVVMVVGVSCFFFQTLLVSLVEIAIDRYILPPACFLPAILCAGALLVFDQFLAVRAKNS